MVKKAHISKTVGLSIFVVKYFGPIKLIEQLRLLLLKNDALEYFNYFNREQVQNLT